LFTNSVNPDFRQNVRGEPAFSWKLPPARCEQCSIFHISVVFILPQLRGFSGQQVSEMNIRLARLLREQWLVIVLEKRRSCVYELRINRIQFQGACESTQRFGGLSE